MEDRPDRLGLADDAVPEKVDLSWEGNATWHNPRWRDNPDGTRTIDNLYRFPRIRSWRLAAHERLKGIFGKLLFWRNR